MLMEFIRLAKGKAIRQATKDVKKLQTQAYLPLSREWIIVLAQLLSEEIIMISVKLIIIIIMIRSLSKGGIMIAKGNCQC